MKKITLDIISNKKIQWMTTGILLFIILIVGANIRLQGLPNLIDPTTGDYTPLALDPYYFLRVSETIHNQGSLPAFDRLRYPAAEVGWTNEILPQSTLVIHKAISIVSPKSTLRFACVINPVVFFVLGLFVFFLLILLLTKNKSISLAACGILAIIPPYLYRTLAGFSDHESIGIFGFFLALLSFFYGMFYLDKKKSNILTASILGLASGLLTMFAIVSWSGGAKFLFMILPLAFIVTWLVKKRNTLSPSFSFYCSWILGVFLAAPMFGIGMSTVLSRFMLGFSGILCLPVLGYIVVNFVLIHFKLLNKKLSKYSEIISVGIMFVLGGILYSIFIGNIFVMLFDLLGKIINPFGSGRVGLTVAENKQPYLNDWISQISKIFFYTALAGCLFVGTRIGNGIKVKKLRPLFIGTFAIFIFGILFSRMSAGAILNGDNFISKTFFFVSFLIFAISCIYIYMKSEWEVDTKWILIVAWMVPMLLAVRSAIRVFFAIVPFVSFIVPLTLFEIGAFAKKSKDNLVKLLSWSVFILLLIGLLFTSFGFYKSVNYQAQAQTPSYNADWQNAMSWVRENIEKNSIFLHWWDYGYWVQTGGQRPTVTDGGHAIGYWDHLIGRYVLTTPNPDSAKSFMKTHNVSYLLIDPTDIGKYSAYSSIGDHENYSDRASYLPTLISQLSEVKETKDGITRIYRGGAVLDSDLIYQDNGKQIFLPKGKAGLGAIIIEGEGNEKKQPTGAFVYNGKQHNLPIRYIFIGNELYDFGGGVNATAFIYPNVYNSDEGQKIDPEGAAIYLSEKTKDSLVAKIYLMDDPDDEYENLELVHSESNYPFIISYGGRLIGPIKIWKVSHSENTIAREEFLRTSGGYGEFDHLEFVK